MAHCRYRLRPPSLGQFRCQGHWPPVVYVDHASGAVGGDDHKAIMFSGPFVRIW